MHYTLGAVDIIDNPIIPCYLFLMTAEPADLKIENALLRAALFLSARALKDYHDSPHFEIDDDGIPKMEVIVPPTLRARAADALARADKVLKNEERGRQR